MAFYLIGLKSENVSGIFFRNHLRQWWPLWDYAYSSCPDILTRQDYAGVRHHDFHIIDGARARKIGTRLSEMAETGVVKQEEQEFRAMLEMLPMEKCILCNGTGFRDPETGGIACRACDGKGEQKNCLCNYIFDENNVIRFAEFCKSSGGFKFG